MRKHFKGKLEKREDLFTLMDFVNQYDFSQPLKVECSPVGSTLDYKAVLAIWFKHIAKHLTDRGHPTSDEEIRELMYHRSFGYSEPRKIGRTEMPPRLITITWPVQKDRGELYNFCREVEEWCKDMGVPLPVSPNRS